MSSDLDTAAIEAKAQSIALANDYDVATITFLRDRWLFGSLSHDYRAPFMRAVYWRAFEIACERIDAEPVLVAAE